MTTKQLDDEDDVSQPGLRLPPCDADLSYSNFRNGWDRAFGGGEPAAEQHGKTVVCALDIHANAIQSCACSCHSDPSGYCYYCCAGGPEIAAAILAERERCAKIAETWGEWCGRDGYDAEEYASRDIAAKIRSGE